jgi:cytochrome P450
LLLTRHQDVRQLLADPRFTRELSAEGAARITVNKSGGTFARKSEVPMAGAAHQHWRRLISKWLTAKRMAQLAPRIEAMADRLIDALEPSGGPADLVAGFAFPLPVWVICDLLGVPDGDREKFSYWSDTGLSLDKYAQDEIDSVQVEFTDYMTAHIAAKRAEPGDDLLSELIEVVDSGDGRLTEAGLVATGQGLLVAGHETTTSTIGKMLAMLLADRSRWEALLAEPALMRTAVEEVLRFDANAGFGLPRYLTEDLDIAGTTLPGGSTVVVSMAAANRDEAAFDRPAEMDLARSPNPHLTFGVGPYSCVGQPLARTELQVALRVLLRRLPTLELAVPTGELPRKEGLLVGALERVMVRW